MPPSEDSAITRSLAEVDSSWTGRKIRVAGKILAYDSSSHLLLLAHHPYGLLVDIELCLDPSQSLHYLREIKGTLMVLGSLERTEFSLDVPVLSKFVEAPSLDDRLVLRATVARSVNDLSLTQWCAGIQSMNEAGRHRSLDEKADI